MINAINLGFDAVEHLATIPFLTPQEIDGHQYARLISMWEEIDEGTIEDIAQKMASRNIAVSTTLGLLRGFIGSLKIDKRKYGRYITPWYKYNKIKNKEWRKVYNKVLRATKILWENDVSILSGTDIPNQALTPGLGLLEELDILQEAGLEFWDSLKTATGIASKVVGTERGTIKEGKYANVLLLSKVPKKPADLLHITAIILGNKILRPSDIKSKLRKIPLFSM